LRVPGINFSLYLITDRRLSAPGRLTETIRQALDGGARCVQLREKDLPGAELFRLAVELRELTLRYNALLLINDRLDIALASGADGVHLAVSSLPVREVRLLAGGTMMIGYSAHNVDEALTAQSDGADFVTFGPVYHTSSKAAYGDPCGVNKLTSAVSSLSGPVFALGGVGLDNIEEVLEAGVRGIALISAIQSAVDPGRATVNILKKIEEHARHNR
jgi:thiamine-phosphate pyrophosphorylase